MTQQQIPQWYRPEDIAASVRHAINHTEISTDQIVDVLVTNEVDASRGRVEALVEAARNQVSTQSNAESPPHPNEEEVEPRPLKPRVVASEDFAYLGPTDFARVLGGVLTRYEGGFKLPEQVDECSVDLFWHRQRTTVALRTVPRISGTAVDKPVVQAVAAGDTDPTSGRPASTVAVVTNTEFTDAAHDTAAANDVLLFEHPVLEQWLRDIRLTHDVLGSLLEHHDLTDKEYDTILDDLPALPPHLQEANPLNRSPTAIGQAPSSADRKPIPDSNIEPDTETLSDSISGELLDESPQEAGEQGVLYADPDEDGDAEAFDRLAAKLTEDTE